MTISPRISTPLMLVPLVAAFWLGAALASCSEASDKEGGSGTRKADDREQGEGNQDASSCQMQEEQIANEGANHVDEGTELTFGHNPPASGDHYPVWTRFEAFDDEIVPPGYWVHNLEHGGIVLLYGPDADADEIEALLELYDEVPEDPACDHKRSVLTGDPDLNSTFAAVAWNYALTGDCLNPSQVLQFVDDHRGLAPEDVCSHGSYVP